MPILFWEIFSISYLVDFSATGNAWSPWMPWVGDLGCWMWGHDLFRSSQPRGCQWLCLPTPPKFRCLDSDNCPFLGDLFVGLLSLFGLKSCGCTGNLRSEEALAGIDFFVADPMGFVPTCVRRFESFEFLQKTCSLRMESMAFRRWKPTEIEQTRHGIFTVSLSVNGSLVVGVCVIFFRQIFSGFQWEWQSTNVATDRYSVDLGVQPDQFLFNKLISICAKSKVRFWFLTSCFSVESWFYCEFFWDWKLLNWQEGLSESQQFGRILWRQSWPTIPWSL